MLCHIEDSGLKTSSTALLLIFLDSAKPIGRLCKPNMHAAFIPNLSICSAHIERSFDGEEGKFTFLYFRQYTNTCSQFQTFSRFRNSANET